MRARHLGFLAAGTLVAAGLMAVGGVRAAQPQDQPAVTVYKSPT
jgi:hypothetical protein